jgi:UDP-glucose 4-epimerase
MKNQRVLITGGAGLIGSHIADALVREGAGEIVVLDNFSRGKPANLDWAIANGPVKVVQGDIRDQATVERVMHGIDVVFHQAAIRITQCASDPALALDVLAGGTFNVLQAAVGAGVGRVIAASSASVYGLAETFPTKEDHHPYNNSTLYGAAKLFNEGLLRSYHDMFGLSYVALRYFNVYGPRIDATGAYTEVFIRWLERIAAGQPPLIAGDGTQTLDFVHVEDVARANILAAKSGYTHEVFNIGSGTETSLHELACLLLEVTASSLGVEHVAERRVNSVRRRLADVSKAKQLLGFETQIDMRQGVRTLVDWWTQQRTSTALDVATAS